MRRRPGEKDGVAKIRESFARSGKPGRLDFLFDGRTPQAAPPPAPSGSADEFVIRRITNTPESAPWESPPPSGFRGDEQEEREAFLSAGVRSRERRFALTLALPLVEPLRAMADAAAILFYGVIAAVFG